MTIVDTAQVICPLCGGIGQVTAGTACQCCRGIGMCGPNRAREYEERLSAGQLETVRAALAGHAADAALAYRRAVAAARRCETLLAATEAVSAKTETAHAEVMATRALAARPLMGAVLPPLPPGHAPTVPGQAAKDPLLAIDSILVRELDVWGPLNAPNFQPVTGLQPSGDTSGVTDTGTITAALAAGNTTLAPGVFYINGPILVPAHLQFEGSGALTRIMCVGSGDFFQVYGGVKPATFGAVPNVSLAGRIANMTIDGALTSSTVASTGLHIGSGIGFSVDDVFVTNFANTPNSINVHLDNNAQVSPPPWYTEKAHIRVYTANGGVHLMLDSAGASNPSYEYNDITVYLLWVPYGQVGVMVKDGAFMAGASLTVRGNFDSSSSLLLSTAAGSVGGILANIATWANPAPGQLNVTSTAGAPTSGTALVPTSTGYGLISYTGISGANLTGCQYIGGSPAGTVSNTANGVFSGGNCLMIMSPPTGNVSIFQDVTVDIGVEVNNGRTNGPGTVFFGQNQTGGPNSPNQLINSSGRMAFRFSPWADSNAVPGGQVSFAGPIRNSPNLATANTQLVNGSLDLATAGGGLQVKEGTNCKQGTAVLNGTTAVVVANTSVTANSRIFLTINTPGGTPASPYVSATSPGTSFSIKSTGAADTSTVAYQIFEPG